MFLNLSGFTAVSELLEDCPLKEFSLGRAGVSGFPWQEVLDKSEKVDFGSWDPDGLDKSERNAVLKALAHNTNLRAALVGTKKEELEFVEGWATKDIGWSGSAAFQASPSLACLLLECCTCLDTLDLRCI